jgi:hypothetical protein
LGGKERERSPTHQAQQAHCNTEAERVDGCGEKRLAQYVGKREGLAVGKRRRNGGGNKHQQWIDNQQYDRAPQSDSIGAAKPAGK